MKDFLTFRRMLAPLLVQIFFWVGVIVCVVSGLVTLFTRDTWLLGLETLIVGPLIVRLACELIILFFRMNETLTDISRAVTGCSSQQHKKDTKE